MCVVRMCECMRAAEEAKNRVFVCLFFQFLSVLCFCLSAFCLPSPFSSFFFSGVFSSFVFFSSSSFVSLGIFSLFFSLSFYFSSFVSCLSLSLFVLRFLRNVRSGSGLCLVL